MKRLVDEGKSGGPKEVGRREFLLALASSALAPSYLRGQTAAFLRQGATPKPGAQATPPTETIKGLVTPNAEFYVRNHFETPRVNSETWNLQISGLVSKPLQLSYSDLLLTSSVPRTYTVECAGNRSGGKGVGTAVWSGLPLVELLKQAGLKPGATTVVFHGADSGDIENLPPGTHFARAIPLEKAMDPSTLLAYEMNGEPLPADHGFPLRAIVPGWYGMDSVKWLTRIEILDQPFKGYFQQEEYVAVKANGERRTITRILVGSKFLRPSEGEEILSKTYRVEGAAWAGERRIAKVELRVDNDAWQQVSLPSSQTTMVWTPWSYEWHIPRPGQHTLEVRATDDEGHSQPDVRDPDRKDPYEVNTPHRVNVIVRS